VKKLLALVACVTMVTVFSDVAILSAVAREGSLREITKTDNQQPRKAVVKFKPQPHCPKKACEQLIEATIVLRAIFRASSVVTDVKFDKVIPADLPEDIVKAFTEESIKAARQIKFDPAMKDGHPVSMYMQLEYNFHCS
jgi:hypothetical protein